MNELPHNELLSAYLDGELTPAERVEVERLLASDPVARKLFGELKALSATLQDLPRQQVGEDLSRHVLRVAERRILSEGEPDVATSAERPEPLSRTLFRRFVTRRTLAWTGLVVAIAIMIRINEKHQKVPQNAGEVDRAVARAPERLERAWEPGPAPTMQAPSYSGEESTKRLADRSGVEKKDVATASAPLFRGEVPLKSAQSISPKSEFADKKTTAHSTEVAASPKQECLDQQLVIQCDIDAEADANRTFEKLLAANSVVWHDEEAGKKVEAKAKAPVPTAAATAVRNTVARQRRVSAEATPAQITAVVAGLAAQPLRYQNVAYVGHDGDSSSKDKRSIAGYGTVDRLQNAPTSASGVDLGYSSADAFSRRAPAELPARNVSPMGAKKAAAGGREYEFRQNALVAGPAMQSGTVGQLDMSVRETTLPQPLNSPTAVLPSRDDRFPVSELAQVRQGQEPMSRQRVLFVLNVVEPSAASRPAAAATPAATKAAPSASPR